ncbi:hypothetical protein NDU88_000742, partial [Pleurodeles waltl]
QQLMLTLLLSSPSVSSLLQRRKDPLSVCADPHRPPLRPQICTCSLPQPQEEERAWKCLHTCLL